MKLLPQSPKKALKAFLKQKPLRSEIDSFKSHLISLLDKISIIEKLPKDESEEHLKNNLRDFLRDTYYKETNGINTKDKKDLVIHLGKGTDSEVGVIIEAKRPTNINEMVSAEKPNKKALHELIWYYLNERIQSENNQLKQLVITNVYEWFIIDANYFDKHIYRNTQIKKLYDTKLNDKKDNPFFYEEVAKIISKIDINIPCVYFNIKEYETILRNTQKEDDKELIALFKILSPQFLLKLSTSNDSNTLNAAFYKELLHIIGLEEAKVEGKNIIRRKLENRNSASLIELTIDGLQTEDTLHRIPDLSIYGDNKEDRIFNIALELCLTWINRILFLKLLEGQLITYHQGDKEYKFLNFESIRDFDEVFKLFHKVLAVNIPDRTTALQSKYSKVPYLNSSLFEISGLEDQTIKINSLSADEQLDLWNNSILKEKNKKVNKLPTLEYLFHFLDAFDFASEGTEDVQEDNKNLINASVLGKVFEKINGYKDGSIFTPSFITMYMCRQSIRLAIIEKFNNELSKKGEKLFDKFDDLKNYTSRLFKTQEILNANETINSIRLCDPAVGSGHFLVSALNEIISIKAELGILADDKGNVLSGYEIEIVNDELIITDQNGNLIEYKLVNGKPINKEVQRIQKTLFHEKQSIIENCLFGVDVNPKSVLICRLRLWIELLKNAYYREPNFSELETLPNIDINIKYGNSLLSRFTLDADLSKALKSIKYDVKAYRGFVNDYKNEKSREVKRGLQKIIDGIKSDFKTEIFKNDTTVIKLNKLNGELYNLLNQVNLFESDKKGKKAQKEKQQKLEDDISKLSNEIEGIKNNSLYKNAFEWRFEFPEVLNNNGDFVGFDVIIGNPPYVDLKGLDPAFVKSLFAKFTTTENRINLYSLFIELSNKILKENGKFSFINPNSILMNSSYSKIRNLIAENVYEIIKLPDNIFSESEVKVETIILSFSKNEKIKNLDVIRYKNDDNIDFINRNLIEQQSKEIWNSSDVKFNIYLTNDIQKVLIKAIKDTEPLVDLADFTLGITPYDKYKGHSEKQIKERVFHSPTKKSNEYKPLITGENIQRYYTDSTPKEYLKYGSWLGAAREERFFTEPRVIVRQIVSGNPPRIYAGYSEESLYFTQIGFSIIPKKEKNISPKYLTALLNSSLINFIHKYLYLDIEKELFQKILIENCKQFPIKMIPMKDQVKFNTLVDKIISLKQKGKDSSECEKEIDQMVYDLYELGRNEIKIIENS